MLAIPKMVRISSKSEFEPKGTLKCPDQEKPHKLEIEMSFVLYKKLSLIYLNGVGVQISAS